MRGVQETSREAYQSILGNLGRKQQTVFDTLKEHGPMTNLETAFVLHWSINRITPRMGELVNRGLVRKAGRRPCTKTGFMAYVWEVVPEEVEQLSFI